MTNQLSSQAKRDPAKMQLSVYVLGGGLIADVIIMRMLLIFYGVAIPPLLYFELLASIIVCLGGALSVRRPHLGRVLAIIGVLALITIWIPWVNSLVPVHAVTGSPFAYLVVLTYAALAAFVFLYPSRFWFSIPAIAIILLAGIISGAATYSHRVRIGEYDWPEIECFRWQPDDGQTLSIQRDSYGYVDDNTKRILQDAGVRGTITLHGGSGGSPNQKRILVIASKRPPASSRLYHPKQGTVIYLFDGVKWIKLPADAETYSRYSSFERPESDNPDNMICNEEIDGAGTGCTICLGSLPE